MQLAAQAACVSRAESLYATGENSSEQGIICKPYGASMSQADIWIGPMTQT